MAGEERFYYSAQEFSGFFFAYGFKKNVHPHEYAKPNAPPKKIPTGSAGVAVAHCSENRGVRDGERKMGGTRSTM
jgi:hypothetical protein